MKVPLPSSHHAVSKPKPRRVIPAPSHSCKPRSFWKIPEVPSCLHLPSLFPAEAFGLPLWKCDEEQILGLTRAQPVTVAEFKGELRG